MWRLAAVVALLALAPPADLAASHVSPPPSPVPEDIKLALAEQSIGVADATDVSPVSLRVSSARARRVALKNFSWTVLPYRSGWIRMNRITTHLVRLSEIRRASGRFDFPDMHPLHAGDLAWLVVIRDATLPLLGPPGRPGPRSYMAPLAVFVSTDEPRYVRAMSI